MRIEWIVRLVQHGEPRQPRHDFSQQLDALADRLRREKRHTRCIAAWTCERGYLAEKVLLVGTKGDDGNRPVDITDGAQAAAAR